MAASEWARRLDEWEARAQLSDVQRTAVTELQTLGEDLPLPATLTASTTATTTAATTTSVATTNGHTFAATAHDADDETIENAQQFFNWFDHVGEQMERGREDVYRSYLGEVAGYRNLCDSLLYKCDETTTLLFNLEKNYMSVAERATALQDACEKLLQQQTHLVTVADALSDRLSYFNELEVIARLFNTPGETVVLHQHFIPFLGRLDQCLAYVEANASFKDAEIYNMKFHQCMTRGLTLIKMHFVDTIKLLTTDVLQRVQTPDSTTESAETALFYVKFRALAPLLRPLLAELEQRAHNSPEYGQLLNDCVTSYIAARTQLLGPSVDTKLLEQSQSQGLVAFGRSGSAYILRVCNDELQLFHHFFAPEHSDAQALLDAVVVGFHDITRPRIIRETSVDVLTELCEVLLMQMTTALPVGANESDRSLFQLAVRGVLEDTQARLVYRVQALISAEIEGFAPAAKDLAYPEKLENPTVEDDDTYREWFPTLRVAVSLLSKLHRCVNERLFNEVSYYVITNTQSSLIQASLVISRQKTRLDGQLFLIKHLLLLRQQLAPFDSNFVRKEKDVDFVKLRAAAQGLLSTGSNLFSLHENALLSFLRQSLPKAIVVSEFDCKKEVDNELKRACDALIQDSSRTIIEPIATFLARANAFRYKSDAKNGTLGDQEFAGATTVANLGTLVRDQAVATMPRLLTKLNVYLKDAKTEDVLAKAIKGVVLSMYKQYVGLLQSEYDVRVSASAVPLHDLREALDVVTLTE